MSARTVERTVRGPAYEWSLWSTTMRLVTSDPHALASAKRLIDAELAHVELAASRCRADSEVCRLDTGRPVRISPTLTSILAAALGAARGTDGAVDPTFDGTLEAIDDRGVSETGSRKGGFTISTVTAGRWQDVELDEDGRHVTVPHGVLLDLGSIAKAWAADRCAQVVADRLEVGVLISLGGDIATAGPVSRAGVGGWEVLVQDQPEDPAAFVAIPTGVAMATSSTASRTWRADGRELHHLLAPGTGMPVGRRWRSATVVAPDCVTAHTWSTAALVAGAGASETLGRLPYPARLVGCDGSTRLLGGWPQDAEQARAAAGPAA